MQPAQLHHECPLQSKHGNLAPWDRDTPPEKLQVPLFEKCLSPDTLSCADVYIPLVPQTILIEFPEYGVHSVPPHIAAAQLMNVKSCSMNHSILCLLQGLRLNSIVSDIHEVGFPRDTDKLKDVGMPYSVLVDVGGIGAQALPYLDSALSASKDLKPLTSNCFSSPELLKGLFHALSAPDVGPRMIEDEVKEEVPADDEGGLDFDPLQSPSHPEQFNFPVSPPGVQGIPLPALERHTSDKSTGSTGVVFGGGGGGGLESGDPLSSDLPADWGFPSHDFFSQEDYSFETINVNDMLNDDGRYGLDGRSPELFRLIESPAH